MELLIHEYFLTLYGVLLWQVEQITEAVVRDIDGLTFRQRIANILRSMGWAGLLVIFDDELLARYNEWAAMDYIEFPKYGYVIAGFFIDLGLSKILKK